MWSSKPWLLVFDLDGTLIDSSLDLLTAVNAALVKVGRTALPQVVVNSFIGDGAVTLVRRALAHTKDSAPILDEDHLFEVCFRFFLEYYHDHKLDNTRTYPGVLESLAAIQRSTPELLMAVLTNKPVRPSREICAALGLSKYFFANYGGDSFATKKPAPEGLLSIIGEAQLALHRRGISRLALPSDAVVMIGDSEADVRAGQACGVRTLGCSYGLSPETLRLAGPDAVVASPLAWPEVLGLQR